MKYLVVQIGGPDSDKTFALAPDAANALAKTPLKEMMEFCEHLRLPMGKRVYTREIDTQEKSVFIEIAPLMCDSVEHEEFKNEVITWSNDMYNW